MAAKKTTRKKGKSGKSSSKSISLNLTTETKSILLRCLGVCILLFAVFTIISVVSYLFTWREDQSIAGVGLFAGNVEAMNLGGHIGYKWSRFLMGFLGFGSFAFVALAFIYSYALIFRGRQVNLWRVAFLSCSGAIVLAMLFSLFGSPSLFGTGLGGDSGYAIYSSISRMVGKVIAAIVIFALFAVWLMFVSKDFAHWVATSGEQFSFKKLIASFRKHVDDDDEDDEEDEDEDEAVQDAPVVPVVPINEIEPETHTDDEKFPDENIQTDQNQQYQPSDPILFDINQKVVTVTEPVENPSVVPSQDSEEHIEAIHHEDLVVTEPEELPRFDNREELDRYEFPPLDLLKDYADGQHRVSQMELDTNNSRIRTTLQNFKIDVERVSAVVGPTVTLYKVVLAPGMRVSAVEGVRREIAMALGAGGVRVVTLPGCVGIEVPNSTPSIVPLKTMLNDDSFRNSSAELPIALGYTITQEVKTFDLTDAPHLLVAGATKQGKSVGLNVIISSLLYAKHPSELKLVFIDPKMVEFTSYNHLLKHYLAVLPLAASEEDEKRNAIVKTPKQAEMILNSLCIEMDERYNLLATAGVNDFKLYNERYKDRYLLPTEGHKYLPYLVVVIDEYADLIMAGGTNPDSKKSAKNIEASIIRLAQKGRAAGIHVIIATQRPSVNVITGLIKANFPTRIAFRVLSGTDSRTILDSTGAENLVGKGDMLYYAGVKMERVQCALVTMPEINKITKFIGSQNGYKQCYSTPYYLPVPEAQDGEPGGGSINMDTLDALFEDAARLVVTSQKGSTSDIQRRLGIGYARAGRVMDQLEGAGIVGPQEGSKPRQVLIADLAELEEAIAPFLK